jgi:Zn-dependent protease with chaperone function
LAAAAVLLVAALFWGIVDYGLPYAAARVAEHIPVEAEDVLGREALAGMDQFGLKPSRLPAEQRAQLGAKFVALAALAPDAPAYQLEFRMAPAIGANAFALPSGIIVLTDELARLAEADEEILAVLAHELGHVRHRHIMRHLLEGSAVALLVTGVTGDVATATSLAAAAPTLVLQSKFSRDNEREADAYGLALRRSTSASFSRAWTRRRRVVRCCRLSCLRTRRRRSARRSAGLAKLRASRATFP